MHTVIIHFNPSHSRGGPVHTNPFLRGNIDSSWFAIWIKTTHTKRGLHIPHTNPILIWIIDSSCTILIKSHAAKSPGWRRTNMFLGLPQPMYYQGGWHLGCLNGHVCCVLRKVHSARVVNQITWLPTKPQTCQEGDFRDFLQPFGMCCLLKPLCVW